MVLSYGLSMLWENDLFQGVGPAVIAGGLLALYDSYLWKYPVFRILCTVPNLNGVYEGGIQYKLKGKDSWKDCTIAIKQTCSNLKIKADFKRPGEDDTQSESRVSVIKTDEVGEHKIYFLYHNGGSHKSDTILDAHDGVNILNVEIEDTVICLKGHYFTNREQQTKGTIEVSMKKGA